MLTFADNTWQVFSSFAIFFAGLSIAIGQKKLFGVPQKRAIALYLWHSFFSIFYFWFSLSNTADATLYYLNSLSYDSGFNFGTPSIYFLVSPLTQVFGLSYDGVFLLFNIVGYIGLLAFASSLQSVSANSTRRVKQLSILILFLPGLSFWSSAIGKDALTFMAAGLATWAALDIKRRSPAMALSVMFFLLPRPHMAGIILLSASLALLFSSGMGLYRKLLLLAVLVPTSILALQFALNYIGLNEAVSISKVNEYMETRQGYNLGGGSSVDIASMSLPLRLFTYLFRPLLFDARGLFGLVASLENILLLFVFLGAVFRKKRSRSVLNRFALLFFVIFVIASWFILANTTANLGIAVRQKIMFLPMLVVFAFSYFPKATPPQITRIKQV